MEEWGSLAEGIQLVVFRGQYDFGLRVRAWMGLEGQGQFTLETG